MGVKTNFIPEYCQINLAGLRLGGSPNIAWFSSGSRKDIPFPLVNTLNHQEVARDHFLIIIIHH